jgi:HAD superfamily hydrolase (TIGR01509 family)
MTIISPQAIVFDFGGVLVDWNPRYFDDDEAVERFLAAVDFAAWNLELDRGRPFAEAIASWSRQFPEHADLIAAYDDRWEDSIAGPIAGTVQILDELRTAGRPLYGLSNWSAETFERIRGKFNFFESFEHIVLSGIVKVAKPDTAIYRALLDRSGLSAQACLFIDDAERNVSAARALGFDAVLFESPPQLRRELAGRGLLKD